MMMKRLSLASLLVLFGVAASRAADVQPTLRAAQDQFESDHYEQALKLYRQAAEDATDDSSSIEYNIGLCHLRLGDGDKAIERFEDIASRTEARPALRSDALFNLGVIRATAARQQLGELLAPATQPTDQKPAPDSPDNIETLQAIAGEMLRAIGHWRGVLDIGPDADAEHNIRAARILRRNVLGLLRRATEEKEKNDILDDPRAYLDTLIHEQGRLVAVMRYMILQPIDEPTAARHARRAAIRAQRKLMERTGVFADHLAQFREAAESPDPAASQPAGETPREQAYHAVAAQVGSAIDAQRDACAFLLEADVRAGHDNAFTALDTMVTAAGLFPQEPQQALVRARTEQVALRDLVEAVESPEHWLRDPLLADAPIPAEAIWPADQTALHYGQARIGRSLGRLRLQCEHVATTSQPAAGAAEPAGETPPHLDPELNRKLAEALAEVDTVNGECLTAIAGQDKAAALAAQARMLELIDAALALLPKTIEQKIMELVVRQGRLNDEVIAEVGEKDADPEAVSDTSLMGRVRELTARLKSAVFKSKPADAAQAYLDRQRGIEQDTVAVREEVREQVPTGTATGGTAAPGGQSPQVQAYIEAGKHLDTATFEMRAAGEGLERAVVVDSLDPLRADGPVQVGQRNALEALLKALAALRPPEQQPQEDSSEQKDQQQQQQPQPSQDVRRNVDRMDKEREEAERQLHEQRPRTVIRDW
ncbi:MAG: hypothetical protein JXA69_15355 [Phycisphaerae bacterium]|nr:hypothetical protein [Phycisphaerae bacterium]